MPLFFCRYDTCHRTGWTGERPLFVLFVTFIVERCLMLFSLFSFSFFQTSCCRFASQMGKIAHNPNRSTKFSRSRSVIHAESFRGRKDGVQNMIKTANLASPLQNARTPKQIPLVTQLCFMWPWTVQFNIVLKTSVSKYFFCSVPVALPQLFRLQ